MTPTKIVLEQGGQKIQTKEMTEYKCELHCKTGKQQRMNCKEIVFASATTVRRRLHEAFTKTQVTFEICQRV